MSIGQQQQQQQARLKFRKSLQQLILLFIATSSHRQVLTILTYFKNFLVLVVTPNLQPLCTCGKMDVLSVYVTSEATVSMLVTDT